MLRYRDLLTAALAKESVGYSPVSAWKHHPIADQNDISLAEATLAEQARFDFDFAKVTPASTWQSRDHGLEDRWAGDAIGRREIAATVIHQPEDWLRLRQLDPWHGFSGHILRAAQQVRRSLPAQVPLLATVFNPLFQASQLAGLATLRDHAQYHRPLLEQGLSTLAVNTQALIAQMVDLGIDGIFLATQHAGRDMLAPAPYASLALAADLACLKAAPLPFNMLHLHGGAVCWEMFATLKSAVVHYDAAENNPDPLTLSDTLAGGIATGPHPHGAILHGSADEVVAEVMALRCRMAGRKFVLAPGCALPLAVSDSQVEALVHAARLPLRESLS
jgi:uroporphyrinogen decarboxylase